MFSKIKLNKLTFSLLIFFLIIGPVYINHINKYKVVWKTKDKIYHYCIANFNLYKENDDYFYINLNITNRWCLPAVLVRDKNNSSNLYIHIEENGDVYGLEYDGLKVIKLKLDMKVENNLWKDVVIKRENKDRLELATYYLKEIDFNDIVKKESGIKEQFIKLKTELLLNK